MHRASHMFFLGVVLIASCGSERSHAQSLYQVPSGIETRWASPENPQGLKGQAAQTNDGRKGRPFLLVKAGEQLTLAEAHNTSGIVRRIWATLSDRSPAMLRGLKIEMFWDESTKPAVSAPFGDFFGFGLGDVSAFESALFSSPEGRSFNCYIPMPFKSGMKIVLTNESGKDLEMLFYDVNYTLGDLFDSSTLYFHAYYHRENPTKLQRDFEILPRVQGTGRFLGVAAGVQANKALYFGKWWGEGEVKLYLDGDRARPTLAGTGSEDYVGTAWGEGRYSNLFQGVLLADEKNMRYSFYRFHIPDPIYFRSEIRVTIQQIGFTLESKVDDPLYNTGTPVYAAGQGLVEREKGSVGYFERQDDWSACAYFYLSTPVDSLPAIESASIRMRGLGWVGPHFGDRPLLVD